MLTRAALGFLNHLLRGESWARERLAVFAGKTVRLQLGGDRDVVATIGETGLLGTGADPGGLAGVTVTLPADAPARWLVDRASLFSSASISGSADLAEALSFVVRNLRWDIEHDLSQVVGDILARRGVQLGRQFADWQLRNAERLAQAAAEYLTGEAATLARRSEVAAFCSGVDAIRDDLARLEKRLQRVEAG